MHGTAALRCCWRRRWPMPSGIRAAGFRTALTRWRCGACLRRYSRCSRMAAGLPPYLPYTEKPGQRQPSVKRCRLWPIPRRRESSRCFQSWSMWLSLQSSLCGRSSRSGIRIPMRSLRIRKISRWRWQGRSNRVLCAGKAFRRMRVLRKAFLPYKIVSVYIAVANKKYRNK